MEEENERILEFAKVQQQREEDRMEKKKQQEESMAAVQQKVRIIAVKLRTRKATRCEMYSLIPCHLFYSMHARM